MWTFLVLGILTIVAGMIYTYQVLDNFEKVKEGVAVILLGIIFSLFAGIILFDVLIASSLLPEYLGILRTLRSGVFFTGMGLLAGSDLVFRYQIQQNLNELKNRSLSN